MKNRILSITVESRIDGSPDTSFLGEYTNRSNEWNIDRRTGEYIHREIVRDRCIDSLKERIEEKENGNENFQRVNIPATLARIEKLEAIDFSGYIGRNEYRYFHPYVGGDKQGTPEYKKYGKRDYERMESLNNGHWSFIGIIAKATIQTENGVLQHITSSGLWGIESDSGEYINEVAGEQINSLKRELSSIGFSERAIIRAMQQWNGEIINK